MQKIEEIQKRPYSKPKIVMVQLNHEQAVLSQCSINAQTISTSDPTNCEKRRGPNLGCRQASVNGDSAFSS